MEEGQVTPSGERGDLRNNAVGFDEGERGREPRRIALEAGKGKETDSPHVPEPLKGAWSRLHRVLSQ